MLKIRIIIKTITINVVGIMGPFPPSNADPRYSKEFANKLGVVCDCCDGEEGDQCRSSWEGSCSKLRCLPWKYH
ncbi:hypothetical protein LOK49_LG01G00801 [Camellia lanceoleosa]|uniref:Uncharacterized protein n=1 Tax=Camellia lanceoleosa TaxID=1840588 RepID=A0ACC0IW30_9ERIC|nr:hypothetical protein LOK49_LG01G00801 [Camellia lanceoleosa]